MNDDDAPQMTPEEEAEYDRAYAASESRRANGLHMWDDYTGDGE
jgi:hypothetical protein